jgi:hypothetical protein
MQLAGIEGDDWIARLSDKMVSVVEGHAREYFTAIRTHMHPGTDWDYLSCNRIGQDGKYVLASSHEAYVTPVAGTGVAANWRGPDVSVAVTLLTAQQRGYASKGRIFLPTTCIQLKSTVGPDYGDLEDATRNTLGSATASFISNLNALGVDLATPPDQVVGISSAVCVFSPGTGKKQDMTKPGAFHPVTQVRVGAQPDTQRRRLNKQSDLWDAASSGPWYVST